MKHQRGLLEFGARFVLGTGCAAAIGFVGWHFYRAFETRIRQRELVASVADPTESAPTPPPGEIRQRVSASPPESVPGRADRGRTRVRIVTSSHNRDNAASLTPDGNGSGRQPAKDNVSADASAPKRRQSSRPLTSLLKLETSSGDVDEIPVVPRWLAPDISLTALTNDQQVRPSDYKSKQVVLLGFWATWCGPCLQELPVLDQLVASFPPESVKFFAVNTEESPGTIRKVLQEQPKIGNASRLEVVMDPHGTAAAKFGVEQLPTLVMIDRQGAVQRIHVGFEPGDQALLKSELTDLIADRELAYDPNIASYLHDRGEQKFGDAIGDRGLLLQQEPWKDVPNQHPSTTELRLTLASGREIAAGEIFQNAKDKFGKLLEDTIERTDERVAHINYKGTNQTSLILGRRGRELHGPMASFQPDGSLLAYIHYRFGKRVSNLLTWDDTGRPLVLEQYANGQREGLRILFKSCGEGCDTGHVWLIEEWTKGELLATHIALPNGQTETVETNTNTVAELDSKGRLELSLAQKELVAFQTRLDSDEGSLRDMVGDYYSRLRQTVSKQVQTRLAASQSPSHRFALQPSQVRTPYGFSSDFGFTPTRSSVRVCRSS